MANDGLDLFGCDDPAYVGASVKGAVDKTKEGLKEVGRKIKNLQISLGTGGSIGVVAGAGFGYWWWRSHRIIGALVGGLVAGPAVGVAIGYGVAAILNRPHDAKLALLKGGK